MIDQCIFEIYQKDKKVFLPDFGAIIYSDFNDSIDFNDLLTFDDGKVVEEIQKQQSLSEDEARNALEEYIQSIKNTLGQGKLHFIGGIGYLSVDDQGSYSIEKTKPDTKATTKKRVTEEKPAAKKKTTTSKKKSTDKDDKKAVSKKKEEPKVDIVPPVDLVEDNEPEVEDTILPSFSDELATVESEKVEDETVYNVEDEPTFNTFASEEESFNAYDDDNESYEKEDNNGKTKKLIWAVVIVILVTIGSFYLYNYFASKDGDESNVELTKSETNTDIQQEEAQSLASNDQNDDAPEKIVEESESTPIQPASVDIEPGDEDKTFCLILGSFKVERNADKYLQRMKRNGLEPSKFKGRRNFYFIGIKSIKGKSNAVRELTAIQQTVPSAWIFNKELLLKI